MKIKINNEWIDIPSFKGNGIESIEKTGKSGRKDIYTIYYTDGTTSKFDVTNGQGKTAELPVVHKALPLKPHIGKKYFFSEYMTFKVRLEQASDVHRILLDCGVPADHIIIFRRGLRVFRLPISNNGVLTITKEMLTEDGYIDYEYLARHRNSLASCPGYSATSSPYFVIERGQVSCVAPAPEELGENHGRGPVLRYVRKKRKHKEIRDTHVRKYEVASMRQQTKSWYLRQYSVAKAHCRRSKYKLKLFTSTHYIAGALVGLSVYRYIKK